MLGPLKDAGNMSNEKTRTAKKGEKAILKMSNFPTMKVGGESCHHHQPPFVISHLILISRRLELFERDTGRWKFSRKVWSLTKAVEVKSYCVSCYQPGVVSRSRVSRL